MHNMYFHVPYTKLFPRQSYFRVQLKNCCKGLLCVVFNIGIYCSSDKVGIFYPLQYIIQNSTVNSHALCESCKDMAWRSSECIITFLCCRYHPLFDRTICLGYPLLFCSLHSSSKPINKNLKGRSLE